MNQNQQRQRVTKDPHILQSLIDDVQENIWEIRERKMN